MLSVGQQAPPFRADSTLGPVDLAESLGKRPIVLIFYPKDETMICTKQLCAVRDSKAAYDEAGALVIGVNPGSLAEHERFAAKHRYDFPLVVDIDLAINRLYGVGKAVILPGQKRIVYVVGREGRIVFARQGNPSTRTILEAIR